MSSAQQPPDENGDQQSKTLKNGQKSTSLKGLRVHECSECGKVYTRNEHLVRHVRAHTGETPYICGYCGMGFPRKDSHDIHVQRVHENLAVSATTSAYQPSISTPLSSATGYNVPMDPISVQMEGFDGYVHRQRPPLQPTNHLYGGYQTPTTTVASTPARSISATHSNAVYYQQPSRVAYTPTTTHPGYSTQTVPTAYSFVPPTVSRTAPRTTIQYQPSSSSSSTVSGPFNSATSKNKDKGKRRG